MPGFPIPLMHYPVAGPGYPVVIMYDMTTTLLRALQYDGEDWAQVGNTLTLTGGGECAICWLSGNDFVLASTALDELRCYTFDGTNFSQVGSSFALVMGAPAVARMDATHIAFFDNSNDSLRCYTFNGSTFSLVGSGLTITTADLPGMASQTSSRIVLNLNAGPRTYSFNGTTWSAVGGAPAAFWTSTSPRLAGMPNGMAAAVDPSTASLRALRDISQWYQTGNPLSISGFNQAGAVASISETEVVVIDGNNELLRTYTLDTSTYVGVWTQTGNPLSIAGIATPALCSLENFAAASTFVTGNQWDPAQTSANITLAESNTLAFKIATNTGNMSKGLLSAAPGTYFEISNAGAGGSTILGGVAGAASTTAAYPGNPGVAGVRPSTSNLTPGANLFSNFTSGATVAGFAWANVGIMVTTLNILYYNTSTGTLAATISRQGTTDAMYPAVSVSDGGYAVINPNGPFRYFPPGAVPMQV